MPNHPFMRSIILLFFAAILSFPLFASNSNLPAVYKGVHADEKLNGATVYRENQFSNIPSYVAFDESHQVNLEVFTSYLKKIFKLDAQLGFVETSRETDKLGMVHVRFRQTLNGHPIDGTFYIAHCRNGKVVSMNGKIYNGLDLPAAPSISETSALANAKDYIGASQYKWELPEEEAHLKWETNDPYATYFPSGELVYMTENASFQASDLRLCWKFNIYAHQPVSRADYYVDALSGQVIFANNQLCHADVQGTAQTVYSGTQTITTDSYPGGYRLRESGRGNGIRTFDMNEGTSYGAAVDFTDADNNWNNVNAQLDQYATDAHLGAEATYDYYLNHHGRNSIDGNGFQLNSYIHYDQNYANAFWDGQRMTYGDGDGNITPLVTVDIASHEITHGLTTFTAGLIYQNESGALNESFSDIFGAAVEFEATPAVADWFMGEDIGSAFRSMSNPKSRTDPDTYFGTYWFTGTGDNGGVHTNSGVQNHWFYLLSDGGTGTNDNLEAFTVDGVGVDTAGEIAFRNLTVYMGPSSQYADARFYAIQSAIDLYGPCTPPVISTANAWHAVGVGVPFDTTVTADFASGITQSCTAPFPVAFNNLSTNAGSYTWDFGDGSPTSAAVNPTHTYNAVGDYTVTLIADGGSCGTATEVKTAFVSIQPNNPCLHFINEGGTKTSCEGTLFDDGGPNFNYSPNQTYTMTIAPTGAANVVIEFEEFDIEPGSGSTCNYDYIEIFDGPNASSPSLGRFCNTTGSPGIITSTGTAITIRHYSDPGLELSGFKMSWHCNIAGIGPSADFTSDVTTTCTGEVNFMDHSFHYPSNWVWDFGDGNTSTVQNPTHVYSNSGTYEVKLIASNSFGTDSVVKTDYVTVSKTAAPTANFATRCGPGNLLLQASAAGPGVLNWFTSSSSNVVQDTGSFFSTPPLSSTTSYWVEEWITPPAQNVGPVDNTFGSGGIFTGERILYFDVLSDFTLVSVLVYADGAGQRTFLIRDALGNTVVDSNVTLADGAQRVYLNWELTPGTSYSFGANASPDLYRNRTGASFPYTIPGVVSITGTDATSSDQFYYYFYDWEVQEPSCRSNRTEVIAVVTLDPVADFNFSLNGNTVNFGNQSQNGTTVRWDFGDGNNSNQSNPSHTYASPGQYTVTMIVSNSCGNDTMRKVVDTEATGIEDIENAISMDLFPNPADGYTVISLQGLLLGEVDLQVYDISGRLVNSFSIEASTDVMEQQLNTESLASGTYLIRIENEGREMHKRLIKQ
jgi:Zn-dependent metalloprotease